MKRTQTSEYIEATAFICIIAAMSIARYYGYVKPADEMRAQVMDCMTERNDTSKSGYQVCFEDLKGNRSK